MRRVCQNGKGDIFKNRRGLIEHRDQPTHRLPNRLRIDDAQSLGAGVARGDDLNDARPGGGAQVRVDVPWAAQAHPSLNSHRQVCRRYCMQVPQLGVGQRLPSRLRVGDYQGVFAKSDASGHSQVDQLSHRQRIRQLRPEPSLPAARVNGAQQQIHPDRHDEDNTRYRSLGGHSGVRLRGRSLPVNAKSRSVRTNGFDFPPCQIWAGAHADPSENLVTIAQSGRYG